jgi:hypothetical protein
VLLPCLVTLALTTVGLLIVAKVAHIAIRRLGLELYGVLLWLGLAEQPLDELSARRAGLHSARARSGRRRVAAPASRRHRARRGLGRAGSA